MDKNANLLEFVPQKSLPWEVDEKGRVYLIKEKTRNRWLKKLIGLLGRSQVFHIHLDDLGSEVWLQADGRRTIFEIGLKLREKFGPRAEPAPERAAKFFAQLFQNQFVIWADPTGGKNKKTLDRQVKKD